MYEISFLTGLILTVACWFLVRGLICLKSKKIDWKYEAKQLFFLVNLMVIVRMTFYPFAMVDGKVQPLIFEPAAIFPLRVNLIPFVNMLQYDTKFDLLINLIGNSTMFIPTGIMVPLIYRNVDSLKKPVLTGFAISLTIELLPLPFAVRASDVDDQILNTAGCLMGYGILCLIRGIKKRTSKV